MYRTLYGENHAAIPLVQHNLGHVYLKTDREEEALRTFERALAGFRSTLDPEHPYIGFTFASLGLARFEMGDLAGAERDYRESIARLRRALGDDHPRLSTAWYGLGRTLSEAGRPEEALQALETALRIQEVSLPPDHPDISRSRVAIEHTRRAIEER